MTPLCVTPHALQNPNPYPERDRGNYYVGQEIEDGDLCVWRTGWFQVKRRDVCAGHHERPTTVANRLT
jgi:hypothetical protein